MYKTLENVLRDGSPGDPVGAQFTLRILENHDGHLDFSITNQAGDTFDFGVTDNEIISYEEA